MLGHGCPAGPRQSLLFPPMRERRGFAPLDRFFFLFLCAAAAAAVGAISLRAADSESASSLSSTRVNLSWTSDSPQKWEGELRIEDGTFTGLAPLGAEPGASVAFYPSEDRKTISISSPEPSAFCGAQVAVAAPPSSRLSLSFRPAEGTEPFSKTFSLDEVSRAALRVPLDDAGHDLVIERAPGDLIPVTVQHIGRDGEALLPASPSMVFQQGETLLIHVPVSRLPEGARRCELLAVLRPTGESGTVWTERKPLEQAAPDAQVEFAVPIRQIEGAFDVALELVEPGGAKGKFFLPPTPFAPGGKEPPPAARRVVQGIALAPARPSARRASSPEPADMRESLLDTIDPTNPSWWKLFARRDGANQAAASGQKHAEDLLNFDFLEMWQWGELQASVKSLTRMGDWGRWDSLWQRPLGSGHLQPLDSVDPRDASFVSLASSGDPADPSWESYTVPIKEPGKPHILEIEYLPDYPQKLGVSVLEPSVSGGLFPRALDTGLIVGNEPLSDQVAHRVLRYSVLFWPKSPAPTILLVNRDTQNPAVYGRIRIYRARDEFTPMVPPNVGGRRRMTAVMSRPTLCDQFLAENAPATAGVVGARDWRTFQQAGERLTGYLKICGWDSLLLSVMADGSALYPSPVLRPNPQFDSGIFLTEGNDPVRKDAVDYLLRQFERENLELTPLFSFNAPLPILEADIRAARRAEGGNPDAYYLIGVKGEPVSKDERPVYNILHPAVQREVLRTLDEFAARYARAPALRDVALDLSSDTFVRLPDNIYNGLDDETILRFAREARLEERCPASLRARLNDFLTARDDGRYYRRASMIRDCLTEDWIRWRAMTVSRFYRMTARVLQSRLPGARLLLLATQSEPVETLPSAVASDRESALTESRALLRRGIDVEFVRRTDELRWIRSLPVADAWRSAGLAADPGDPAAGLAAESAGALFYRDAKPLNIPSFDRVSPYHPTVTQVSGSYSYSDYQNLRRWAAQLAVGDTFALMDGGETLPMGEEESQSRWIAAFRALPAEPFETYEPGAEPVEGDEASDAEAETAASAAGNPVIFRYRRGEDGFWGYLVSTAPFHCGVTLTMNCSPRAETALYAGGRELARPEQKNYGLRWNCSLGPYDLVAFRIDDPEATVRKFDSTLPIDICGEGGRLEEEAKALVFRLRAASAGVETPILNAGFEESLPEPDFDLVGTDAKGNGSILGLEIPKFDLSRNPFADEKQTEPASKGRIAAEPGLPAGWHRFGSPEFSAELDTQNRTEGNASLKMTTYESAGGIIGEAFDLPKTGRLYIDAKFGLPADLPDELPFFVTLTGKQGGKTWQKRLYVGGDLLRRAREMRQNGEAPEGGVVWIRDSLLFDRLPTEETEDFAVRFDLLPRGTVWVDDLHLYKLAFDQAEQKSIDALVDEIQSALERKDTALLLRRADSSAAAMLAAQLPSDAPEMMRMAMREAARETEPAPSGTGDADELEGISADAVPPSPEKNFFQKLIPW
ncbi:MAG: hypothetical protein K6E55_02690 [Thermoguttaceae bacterium]|nr:hypothetical protein [Thermoguttaceae bacterium]